MSESASLPVLDDGIALDDCWNRIGVHGDKQCPLLGRHIHCRNCEVYANAATRLLDRYAWLEDEDEAPAPAAPEPQGPALLLFRLGEEWLALATAQLAEVAPAQRVHALPHQRSRVLLGVANVRGVLVPCLSLAGLIGLDGESPASPAAPGNATPRLLIVESEGGVVVFPVDEVDGIHRLDATRLQPVADNPHATLSVLQWRDRSVRVLDPLALLAAVKRSLA